MAKVYVSSTIIDLKPERQAVLDWLRLARHQAVDSYLPDSESVRPAADGSVSVHRLVQAVTADQMAAELAAKWRQAAAALIEAAIPHDAQLPEAWPACAVLLPHAQVALDLTSDGMWQIARYLGHSGSYPAARDLFRLIADALEEADAYGAEHPRTLTARHYFAHWTGEAGDAAAARDVYAALLPVRVRVSGREHPDTLSDRYELARWTGEAGDPAAARSTRPPWAPGMRLPSGPGRRAMRPPPGTSMPSCCPYPNGSSARSTRTPWPTAATSPTGPRRRGTLARREVASAGGSRTHTSPASGLPATRSARDRLVAVPGRWPGQVIAMAFGAIPTVIGGRAVLVAVRIGVTVSVPPVTYAVLPLGVIAMPKGSFPTNGQPGGVGGGADRAAQVSPAKFRT